MRALRIHGYGGPEAMRLDDVPLPAPAAEQVLVQVRAASINPIDWKLLSGKARALMELRFPAILGRDAAGEVLETGSAVRSTSARSAKRS